MESKELRPSVEGLREIAVRAHYFNSFEPERAAEFDLQGIEDELKKCEVQIPKELIEDFEKHYLWLAKEWLTALSNCASSAVTGPAKFNTRKAERANNRERAARQRLDDFAEKFVKRVNRPQKFTGWQEVERLKIKVENLEAFQEKMKSANKIARSKKLSHDEKVSQLEQQIGVTNDVAEKILTPDVFGIVGFASYALTNNLAKIKQAKERIESITKLVEKGDEEVPFEFGTIEINNDDARIRLHFDCKPDEAMRDKLKKNGFRWSPSNSAWQRQLTNNAIRVTNELFNVEL